ncbi:hypothetical protein [Azotobacter beijerinckii]|nr:hypothetical protein [Azotobacter beijerinckii]
MRDDEMRKSFVIDKHSITIKINDHVISPESLSEDPVFSIPAQHCYCLCLTSKGNDPELFKTFEADICLEIDIEVLMEILEFVFSHKLKGAIIEAREITYYDPKSPPKSINPKDLVFLKPISFSHESEFRVAIFYPTNKKGFKSDSGIIVPFIIPDDSLHITFSHPDKAFIQQCIVGTYEPSNA